MTSLIISIAGALIAFLTTALCGVLAFMGKFALATLDKRIDDAKVRLGEVERLTMAHSSLLASVNTQTQAEQQRFEDINQRIGGLEDKIDELTTAVSELTGQLKRNYTPTSPLKRPDLR